MLTIFHLNHLFVCLFVFVIKKKQKKNIGHIENGHTEDREGPGSLATKIQTNREAQMNTHRDTYFSFTIWVCVLIVISGSGASETL